MASTASHATQQVTTGKVVGLATIRKSAGYRSAKDFAQAMGIPVSTYARYERSSDGQDSGIPIRSAWAIADKLGTTIDAVVGREPASETERDLNAFYRSLSESGRSMFDEYVQFLDFRERVLATEGR